MKGTLERSLSLPGSIGLIVGLVVGASIFILIPSLAGMTGPSLYLAYAVSVIPTIFTGLYLMQLGGAMPVTGANYYAITRCLSPVAGFVSSVTAVTGMISTNCLVAWGFAEYLKDSFPMVNLTLAAVLVVVFFGVVNWIGIRLFEWLQVGMMIFLLAAMLLFIIAGMFHVNPQLHQPLMPNGLSKFFIVIAIATFSWGGFVAITEVAGEIKNPRRNIPLAIIISIVIILFLYVMQTYVFTGIIPWNKAAEIGPTAFIAAARSFLPGWAVMFIVFSALLAMATTINAIILMGAREALAWSRDHVIPVVFNRISRRFNTPEITILMITVISVIGVLFAAELERYALMVVFAIMVVQALGATAVWRMPSVMPLVYQGSNFKMNRFWRGFTWMGCIICFTAIFAFGWMADYKTGIIFVCLVLGSLLYWEWRKRYLAARGIHLKTVLGKESHAFIQEMDSSH